MLLLLPNETGRIVGLDTVLLDRTDDLPAGSVISYTLWDKE